MRPILLSVTAFASLLMSTQSWAESLVFASGEQQNQLVELYTSEGCSSCPPADRWLTSIEDQQGLWNDIVPIAFHVDYWDRLGWKDRFARSEYSQRQRQYAAQFKEPTVYTPGVRRNGLEWRSWYRRGSERAFPKPQNVGDLTIRINDEGRFDARFSPSENQEANHYQLNIAVLGMDAVTVIKRGENRGKTLTHDFVVLEHTLAGNQKTETDGVRWTGEIPTPEISAPRYALAAWVSDNESLEPIQATGGFLK